MKDLKEILKFSIEKKCSYIYITVGAKIYGRINSRLEVLSNEVVNQEMITNLAQEILKDRFNQLDMSGEIHKSLSVSGLGRFKVNVFKQRNSICISLKVLPINDLKKNEKYSIPKKVSEYINKLNQGLILVTGPVMSGKSTTIAGLIQDISLNKTRYIFSVESPIEFLFTHNNSIINQREVGSDTKTYISGIECALRENVDILVVDNIESLDVLKMILKCCDSGMLVISSMYANNVNNTLEILLDMDKNNSIYLRNSLAKNLKCIINQKIIDNENNENICLYEVMINTRNIAEYIKDNKIKNIQFLMQNNLKLGMSTLDTALIEAYKSNKISRNILLKNISNKDLAIKIILNY